jgi:hypothetical protein
VWRRCGLTHEAQSKWEACRIRRWREPAAIRVALAAGCASARAHDVVACAWCQRGQR